MFYDPSYLCNLSRLFCLAIFGAFSVAVFSVSAAETKPLTLKATAQSAKPAQAEKSPAPATKKDEPASSGSFGVKQIDPFRKETTEKKVEKQPNLFQELLDRKVELPKKKRGAAKPVKKATNVDNPFEDAGAEVENPFEGGNVPENPFADGDVIENPFADEGEDSGNDNSSVNPSNPFAAGDPFADEDPRNQVSAAESQSKPKGPTNRAKSQGTTSKSEESLSNPFED